MNARSRHGNATLEELERSNWGEPAYGSQVVTECHRLRRVQLRMLTIENLRILIGQNIGLQFVMPLAVEQLEKNPLAQGDFFPGDLLCSVLRGSPDYWHKNGGARREFAAIAEMTGECTA